MTKILYSPKSRKDLDNIFDYIHDDLNNPVAAKRTVKGILNKINELKEYPQFGPVWYLENNIDSGFRFLRYENYILFYQITKDVILIVRVLHHLQDYVKQLFKKIYFYMINLECKIDVYIDSMHNIDIGTY